MEDQKHVAVSGQNVVVLGVSAKPAYSKAQAIKA